MKEYESPTPDIILGGDFNFPRAVWKHGIGEAFGNTRSEKNSLQHLIDLASDLNLIQKINFGTRKSRSGNNNILELVLQITTISYQIFMVNILKYPITTM